MRFSDVAPWELGTKVFRRNRMKRLTFTLITTAALGLGALQRANAQGAGGQAGANVQGQATTQGQSQSGAQAPSGASNRAAANTSNRSMQSGRSSGGSNVTVQGRSEGVRTGAAAGTESRTIVHRRQSVAAYEEPSGTTIIKKRRPGNVVYLHKKKK